MLKLIIKLMFLIYSGVYFSKRTLVKRQQRTGGKEAKEWVDRGLLAVRPEK